MSTQYLHAVRTSAYSCKTLI